MGRWISRMVLAVGVLFGVIVVRSSALLQIDTRPCCGDLEEGNSCPDGTNPTC